MNRRPFKQRGSDLPATAIIIPALLALTLLAIAFGRYANTGQRVSAAAASAARAASIERNAAAGSAAGRRAALSYLQQNTVPCTNPQIVVNAAGLNAPLGTPSNVQVTISCTASLSDVSLPGLPGSVKLTSTMTSPVDTYRERG